jgi:hypothetical protein
VKASSKKSTHLALKAAYGGSSTFRASHHAGTAKVKA